jgi:hypothetical protein
MPADSELRIYKFAARINICEPPPSPSRQHDVGNAWTAQWAPIENYCETKE